MTDFTVRNVDRNDRDWIAHFLDDRWGSTQIVSRGQAVYGHLLPGIVAEMEGLGRVGLLMYNPDGKSCEIVTLDSTQEGMGIGTTLVIAMKNAMKEKAWKRLWLITTNDNTNALRFWQKRDFQMVAVHRHAIDLARKIKPQIALVGFHNIPIRDEIELEYTV